MAELKADKKHIITGSKADSKFVSLRSSTFPWENIGNQEKKNLMFLSSHIDVLGLQGAWPDHMWVSFDLP